MIGESLLVSAGKVALGVAFGLPLVVYLAQDSLIFHPQPLPESRRVALSKDPLVESVFIDAADGVRLHAWHLKGDPLVLYFGGNAEEVSWMIDDARRRAPGVGWLLVDYRGYGASGGSPSEEALVADALHWFDHISKNHQAVYVLGRSLGSGVAVQLAAARPVRGVILVAPFDSMVELGKRHYPFLPVRWMLKHRFESAAIAPAVKAPLLALVATRDDIIPAEHSRRLYDAWGGPKRWVALEGAGHNSTDDHAGFWPSIVAFLK